MPSGVSPYGTAGTMESLSLAVRADEAAVEGAACDTGDRGPAARFCRGLGDILSKARRRPSPHLLLPGLKVRGRLDEDASVREPALDALLHVIHHVLHAAHTHDAGLHVGRVIFSTMQVVHVREEGQVVENK